MLNQNNLIQAFVEMKARLQKQFLMPVAALVVLRVVVILIMADLEALGKIPLPEEFKSMGVLACVVVVIFTTHIISKIEGHMGSIDKIIETLREV